jgi:uracil-DNA glycosylase family 4
MTVTSLPQLLLPSQPSCRSCPLHAGVTSVGIPSRFAPLHPEPDGTTLLVVVGFHPDFDDDRRGTHFVGATGSILLDIMLAPLRSYPVLLTSALRCCSRGKPPPSTLTACSTHLSHDLLAAASTTRDLHILLLGSNTVTGFAKSFMGLKKWSLKDAMSRTGQTHTLARFPRPVTLHATYHPAFMLNNPASIHATIDHMDGILRSIRGDAIPRSLPLISAPRSPLR